MTEPSLSGDQPDLVIKNRRDQELKLDLHFAQKDRRDTERKTLSRAIVVGASDKKTFSEIGQFKRRGNVSITLNGKSTEESEWVNPNATLFVEARPESLLIQDMMK